MMQGERTSISRPLVGIIAIVCLAAAAALGIAHAGGSADGAGRQMWTAAFVRVGLLMAALWLALPSLRSKANRPRISPQAVIGFSVGLLALARLQLRVLLPLCAILVVIGLVLRPRQKERPPRNW